MGPSVQLGALGHVLTRFGWLSGVPYPLRCRAGPLQGAWMVLGSGSSQLPLVSGGPLPYGHGGSVHSLPLLSSGWMRGCPCGGLPELYALWGLLAAWVLGPSLLASDPCGVAMALCTHD